MKFHLKDISRIWKKVNDVHCHWMEWTKQHYTGERIGIQELKMDSHDWKWECMQKEIMITPLNGVYQTILLMSKNWHLGVENGLPWSKVRVHAKRNNNPKTSFRGAKQ